MNNNVNDNPFDFLAGYKTYIAAAGLFGLGVYQLSQGQFDAAVHTIMLALAAYGGRQAISRNDIKAEARHQAYMTEVKKHKK